jgi:hypothetical protein
MQTTSASARPAALSTSNVNAPSWIITNLDGFNHEAMTIVLIYA